MPLFIPETCAIGANDFSPDLGLPLSRVVEGGWGRRGDMTAEFQEHVHNLGELDESEALQGGKEDSGRLQGWGGRC